MAIDGLRLQPFTQEGIRVLRNLASVHSLKRHIHPQYKVLKDVHVDLDRVHRVVSSLQETSVAHDHMAHIHLSASFR